jgi:hypothetical protein
MVCAMRSFENVNEETKERRKWWEEWEWNLHCHEDSKQFTKTSNYYKLFLKINVTYVKKCKVIWEVLWMHQTKYFGLYKFFDYSCVFSSSLAWIIGSLLYHAYFS